MDIIGGRIRFFGDWPTSHPDFNNLLTELVALTDTVPDQLVAQVFGVLDALGAAVSGPAGLHLRVIHSGQPVTMTLTLTDRVQTSLRIPLTLLSPTHQPGGQIVFYSTVPGAFVDLAADLTHTLHRPSSASETVALDVDLPAGPARSVLTGLDELAALHRAAGVLIDQGHHPDDVHQVLQDRAAAHQMTTLALARQILAGRSRP